MVLQLLVGYYDVKTDSVLVCIVVKGNCRQKILENFLKCWKSLSVKFLVNK